MKRRIILMALMLTAVCSFALYGCAKDDHNAEGTAGDQPGMAGGAAGEQGGGMGVDEHTAQMVKQHEAMMGIQEEWTKARGGIESGDAQTILKSAESMSEKSGALDNFMLHKNPENRDEFLKKASEFKSLVMEFKGYAEKDDVKSLKEVAPKIDAACNGCHQSFR